LKSFLAESKARGYGEILTTQTPGAISGEIISNLRSAGTLTGTRRTEDIRREQEQQGLKTYEAETVLTAGAAPPKFVTQAATTIKIRSQAAASKAILFASAVDTKIKEKVTPIISKFPAYNPFKFSEEAQQVKQQQATKLITQEKERKASIEAQIKSVPVYTRTDVTPSFQAKSGEIYGFKKTEAGFSSLQGEAVITTFEPVQVGYIKSEVTPGKLSQMITSRVYKDTGKTEEQIQAGEDKFISQLKQKEINSFKSFTLSSKAKELMKESKIKPFNVTTPQAKPSDIVYEGFAARKELRIRPIETVSRLGFYYGATAAGASLIGAGAKAAQISFAVRGGKLSKTGAVFLHGGGKVITTAAITGAAYSIAEAPKGTRGVKLLETAAIFAGFGKGFKTGYQQVTPESLYNIKSTSKTLRGKVLVSDTDKALTNLHQKVKTTYTSKLTGKTVVIKTTEIKGQLGELSYTTSEGGLSSRGKIVGEYISSTERFSFFKGTPKGTSIVNRPFSAELLSQSIFKGKTVHTLASIKGRSFFLELGKTKVSREPFAVDLYLSGKQISSKLPPIPQKTQTVYGQKATVKYTELQPKTPFKLKTESVITAQGKGEVFKGYTELRAEATFQDKPTLREFKFLSQKLKLTPSETVFIQKIGSDFALKGVKSAKKPPVSPGKISKTTGGFDTLGLEKTRLISLEKPAKPGKELFKGAIKAAKDTSLSRGLVSSFSRVTVPEETVYATGFKLPSKPAELKSFQVTTFTPLQIPVPQEPQIQRQPQIPIQPQTPEQTLLPKQIQSQKTSSSSAQASTGIVTPIIIPKPIQPQLPQEILIQKPVQIQRIITPSPPITFPLIRLTTIPYTPPPLLPLGLPSVKFGGGAGREFFRRSRRQPKAFTPSAFAAGFGIKGKTSRAEIFTGLGGRPIPISAKKKKKGRKR